MSTVEKEKHNMYHIIMMEFLLIFRYQKYKNILKKLYARLLFTQETV